MKTIQEAYYIRDAYFTHHVSKGPEPESHRRHDERNTDEEGKISNSQIQNVQIRHSLHFGKSIIHN